MDYPKSPPKATFKTRIYHPNIDEKTGAVCLETLKRDWDPKLTLKDILVTISCLLIQPNPDSALNAAAGALIQEDYEAFSTQAQLMTRIHAPIPKHMLAAVQEAKRRGEDADHKPKSKHIVNQANPEEDDMKENDASRPGESSTCPRSSSQTGIGAKRPLSELPVPEDGDVGALSDTGSEPRRKSPRMAPPDAFDRTTSSEAATPPEDDGTYGMDATDKQSVLAPHPPHLSGPVAVCKPLSTKRKGQPRVGIRRL
jgi:ubiquitin-conjugating enzyme E2 S